MTSWGNSCVTNTASLVIPGQRYIVVGGIQSAFVRGLCCCGAWRQFVVVVQVNVEHRKLQLLSTLQVRKWVYRN